MCFVVLGGGGGGGGVWTLKAVLRGLTYSIELQHLLEEGCNWTNPIIN